MTQWIELVTRGQLLKKGYDTLPTTRDTASHELTRRTDTVRNKPEGKVYYFFSDQETLDVHAKVALDMV